MMQFFSKAELYQIVHDLREYLVSEKRKIHTQYTMSARDDLSDLQSPPFLRRNNPEVTPEQVYALGRLHLIDELDKQLELGGLETDG